MDGTEPDVPAFMNFPEDYRATIHSTKSIEQLLLARPARWRLEYSVRHD
jgi:hypothetical protein